MGTRSMICRENADGSVDAIYCHLYGYPENNGRILLQHYTDPAKVYALIALGSLSSLGEEIGNKHKFDDEYGNRCTAHHRDRGDPMNIIHVDELIEIINLNNKKIWGDIQFWYVFRKGAWFVTGGEWFSLIQLTPSMCGIKDPAQCPPVRAVASTGEIARCSP